MELGNRAGVSSKRKEFPGGCWLFFESMCLGEHKLGGTVLGDTVDTAPLGFFLHYMLKRLLIKFENSLFTKNFYFRRSLCNFLQS